MFCPQYARKQEVLDFSRLFQIRYLRGEQIYPGFSSKTIESGKEKDYTMRSIIWCIVFITALSMCLLFSACGNNGNNVITDENYEKIKNGMTLAEVNVILGEGVMVGDNTMYAYGIVNGPKDGIRTGKELDGKSKCSGKDNMCITIVLSKDGRVTEKYKTGPPRLLR